MRDLDGISDQELDRLLAGTAPAGGAGVDPVLARFVREARAAYHAPLPQEAAHRFLAAAIEASRLTIDKGDPVARPASNAHGPDRQASGLPKWRRRTMFSTLFASLTAKIAGVAVAAMAAAGGLAAAGALPSPAQQAMASAASTIGIHLPSPHTSPSPQASGAAAPGEAPTGSTTGVTGTANEGVTGTASAGVNHGNCVSYATGIASSLGLTGSQKGQFVAAVAQDSSAVSAQVTGTATPDAACQTAIDSAKTAALAGSPGQSGSHKPSGVTGTASATAGPANNPTGNGQGSNASSHPGAGDLPAPVVSTAPGASLPTAAPTPTTGSNPAGSTASTAPSGHPGRP
jgi:hypothetical protein